jgi:GMP synthase (glutamine-hydrolysing)
VFNFTLTRILARGEAEEVVSMFKDNYKIPLIHRDASEIFIKNLEGKADPETKRKLLGAIKSTR